MRPLNVIADELATIEHKMYLEAWDSRSTVLNGFVKELREHHTKQQEFLAACRAYAAQVASIKAMHAAATTASVQQDVAAAVILGTVGLLSCSVAVPAAERVLSMAAELAHESVRQAREERETARGAR